MEKFPSHLSADFWVLSVKPLFSYGFTLEEKHVLFLFLYKTAIFVHLPCTLEKKTPSFLKIAFNVSNQQQLLFQFQGLAIQTMPK